MPKFIYVYNTEARDKLKSLGYQLMTGDDRNGIYVFVYDGRLDFENADLSYILSDTLTF